MRTFIEFEGYELLKHSSLFCEKIENYITLLGLKPTDIEKFKDDYHEVHSLFANTDHGRWTSRNFLMTKIQNLRLDFWLLAQLCKNNAKYTVAIGRDLGIEDEAVTGNFKSDSHVIKI